MTIHIAGLGPGEPALLTFEVAALLESGIPVVAVVREHPVVAQYDSRGLWLEWSGATPTRVLELDREGDVAIAVPGDARVLEPRVADLEAMAREAGRQVIIHAGIGPLEPERIGGYAVRTFDGLAAIVARLNAPGGCPWDREQTHESLRHYLLEETYEALEALDSGDPAVIAEELGDLLLQVLMHAEVARREDTFAFGDVTESIGTKLIRRHPHVFGSGSARTAEEVHANWEQLKRAEKPEGSILDGVPVALPALSASQSMQGRARRVGFDWPDVEGPLEKLREEIAEFASADGHTDREEEFGDILFVLANVADRLGVDAEQALRRANAKFRLRFAELERIAQERGVDLKALDLAGLDALWDEAKTNLKG